MNKSVKSIVLALVIAGSIPTTMNSIVQAAETTCTTSAIQQTCLKDISNKCPQFKNCTVVTSKQPTTTTVSKSQTTTCKLSTTTSKPSTTTTKPTTNTKPVQPTQNSGQTSTISNEASEVIRLVNVERSKNGLAPLKANTELSKVAAVKAQDMINKNYFSHTSPTYGSPFDMMKKFGINYTAAGENIAYGQKTPAQVMDGWMNSSGHRANILNSKFTEIGVGVAKDKNGTPYWVQMFANPGK